MLQQMYVEYIVKAARVKLIVHNKGQEPN